MADDEHAPRDAVACALQVVDRPASPTPAVLAIELSKQMEAGGKAARSSVDAPE
ncbi:hypothetical protein [Actinomadura gamaensis]|uniref:Uncharacterized protein n=1 Tax=Actinomadura gamaensis TaxID=1763541 RepID=A0ABV9UD74_9ACTN